MSHSVSGRPVRAHFALTAFVLVLLATALLTATPTAAKGRPESVRFATFNASLNRDLPGLALSDLSAPYDPLEPDVDLKRRRAQAAAVAEIIQRTRPEVLLINEFD